MVLDQNTVVANGFLAENSIDDIIETYLEDFLEKYPNAPMVNEREPDACCRDIYGSDCNHECKNCWTRLMPEEGCT